MTIIKLNQPPADYEVEGEVSTLSEKAGPSRWKKFFQTFAFLMLFVFSIGVFGAGFVYILMVSSEWLTPLVGHGWSLVIQLCVLSTLWAAVAAYYLSKK